MKKVRYTVEEFERDAEKLARLITPYRYDIIGIYGVPRGGIPLAVALSHLLDLELLSEPEKDCLVVDDVIDSGATRKKYSDYVFACIHRKNHSVVDPSKLLWWVHGTDDWIEYWWEFSGDTDDSIRDVIVRFLEYIGEDPNRIGLRETPDRIIRMWGEIFCGYKPEEKPTITVFPNGEDGVFYDQMLVDSGYFCSHCEHHAVPFFGEYYFGYVPDKLIMGASKIARTIDYYSAKLQIAERLVNQVIEEVEKEVSPQGCGLIMTARHLCKEMRGVKKWNSPYDALAVRGSFLTDDGCKAEFMNWVQTKRR